MAYFKPSYGVNGLGIPMGPMDAATLHHSMGYATGEKELLILKDRERKQHAEQHNDIREKSIIFYNKTNF